jgi:regulator of sigma E protease
MTMLLDALRWIGILFLVIMLFNLVIVVHEWGHFLAARWRGLKIEKFQIWFGKPIWKKTINGVQYGLGSIPFGGFVALPQMADMTAIEGSMNADGSPVQNLPKISPLDKIIVAFAGPLFSFMLAITFACIVWLVGKPVMMQETEAIIGYVDSERPAGKPNGLKVGDHINAVDGVPVKCFAGPINSVIWAVVSAKNDDIIFDIERDGAPTKVTIHAPTVEQKEFQDWETKSWWSKLFERPPLRKAGIQYMTKNIAVSETLPNSPAALAGFKKNDFLRTLNGVKLTSPLSIGDAIKKSPTAPLLFEVERDGKLLTISVVAAKPSKPADYKGEGELGLGMKDADEEKRKVDHSNIEHPTPYNQIRDHLQGTFATFSALFSKESKISAGHMSSALGIINVYQQLFTIPNGWMLVLSFTVLLNVGLAIFNLLPIPVLDGGHITMALIEAIGRRPLRGKIVEMVQAGFAIMLLSFMVWVLLKDAGSIYDNSGSTLEFAAPAQAK